MARFLRRRRHLAGDGEAAPRRRSRAGSGVYGLLGFVALLIDLIVGVISLIIVIGILFIVFEGNRDNGLVDAVLDAAKFLAGPFDGMFTPKDRKLEVAINWGIALIVYVIAGRFLSGLLRRRRG